MAYVDLHLHSSHSDGADPPETVAARAAAMGIAVIALTDHDTVSGVGAGREAAAAAGLGFLSGTEISSYFEGREVHVLGLGVDEAHAGFLGALAALRRDREERAWRMVALLREAGVSLTEEAVAAQIGGAAAGRMHVANALKACGAVRTTQEGFDKYLNAGRPAYVKKQMLPVAEAVGWIHAAGGLAFLAHPGLGNHTRKMLSRLLEFPFDGIEAYHVSHSEARTDTFLSLAHDRGLLVTGGSDCHGDIKGRGCEMGKVRTPVSCYERIREALSRR